MTPNTTGWPIREMVPGHAPSFRPSVSSITAARRTMATEQPQDPLAAAYGGVGIYESAVRARCQHTPVPSLGALNAAQAQAPCTVQYHDHAAYPQVEAAVPDDAWEYHLRK